jgi:hypothetical protein
MEQFLDGSGIDRLEKYFDEIGNVLNDDRRRASFAMYAMGLFGDGDRGRAATPRTRSGRTTVYSTS